MPTSPQSVHNLRRQWKPHQERLATIHTEHPTAIRFHRACSWMSEVEQLDPVRHADQILLHQWIAFNALYGQWDQDALEPAADRRSWQAFLGKIHTLDRSSQLVSVLKDHKPLVLCILEDEYLNQYFWQDPSAKSAGRARTGRHKAQSWYVEGRWLNILEQLVTRNYLLRCQLTHGAATCGQPPEPHHLETLPHHDGLAAARHPSSLDRPRLRRRLGANVLSTSDAEFA